MLSETSTDSGPNHSAFCDLTSEIELDDINTDDNVLIRTRNSEYRFLMIDSVKHRGRLSGGSIGEEPREAILIESQSNDDGGALKGFHGLRIGARALFYVTSGRGVERVTTSIILGLTLVRAVDRVSLFS